MIDFYNTSGLAHPIQVIDLTGVCISEVDYSGTGAAMPSIIFDPSGGQIVVETIRDRLASIRKKSHSELGEAWARLAQM